MQGTQDVTKIGQELSQYQGGYSNLKPSKIHTLSIFLSESRGTPTPKHTQSVIILFPIKNNETISGFMFHFQGTYRNHPFHPFQSFDC